MSEVLDEVDARGLLCPLPVLRLRKMLMARAQGERLRLIATDPAAVIDVPHFCAEGGHVMIDMHELADGARVFVVERGPLAPSAADGLTPRDI